jgi:hypothetical protein
MSAFYAQTDVRWGRNLLGFNVAPPFDLARYGCLVTAFSNLLLATTGNAGFTPDWVNNWLKAHQGFTPGGGELRWVQALPMGSWDARGVAADLNAVNAWLKDAPNFAIIEVRNNAGGQHFVLGNLVGQIVDSYDGKQKKLSTYKFVQAHLYSAHSLPVPATPAAPTPVPTPPPLPQINGVTYNPVSARVNINVDRLNARKFPRAAADSPVMAQFRRGYANIKGWTVGQSVTMVSTNRTDDVWLLSENNHWFSQAGTDGNE